MIYNEISRKELLSRGCNTLCSLIIGGSILYSYKGDPLFSLSRDEGGFKRIASHWKAINKDRVLCQLCPNECLLDVGERGVCRVRENINGKLYSLVYSRIAAIHMDPIEKKPLNHFLPGSMALSLATAGCNLSCKFCQNWQLSQSKPEDLDAIRIIPKDIVKRAKSLKSNVIAFTYNEPTVQFEYITETSNITKGMGIKSVIISNGYIKPKASRELLKNLDGVKIDLKAFNSKFYRDICGGHLTDVLKNLETVRSSGKWLETVTLVIPNQNDSPKDIRNMARWVKSNISQDVPMHFTRFHSMYLLKNLPPTPVKTLERCRGIAKSEGIRYAYIGNVPGHKWENTYCHNCDKMIIKRSGFFSITNNIKNGRCPYCKTIIPGVWS
ncbi:MAG: AmmeMemoRadiSam system radical SAM enzyme [Spirochaetota bacterium]|nr:AmmeMemoRadiSam system radical SAM enzyme [Spirochaetota bacterium]